MIQGGYEATLKAQTIARRRRMGFVEASPSVVKLPSAPLPAPAPVQSLEPPAPRYRADQWRVILRQVAAKHAISPEDILGRSLRKRVVHARHELLYRMRNETSMSYPDIARRTGMGDHTAVMSACRSHRLRTGVGQ